MSAARPEPRPGEEAQAVTISVPGGTVDGNLTVPGTALAVVLFGYGPGTRRTDPRHRDLARAFTVAGFGTVLMDLRTREERQQRLRAQPRSAGLPQLADRLISIIDWLADQDQTTGLPVVVFGAGIGTAAALVAAAARPARVRGVIGRGGRADLAGDALGRVSAPVLLIDSGLDAVLQELNRQAAARLPGAVQRVTVPGASQLFEEPGAIEAVREYALEALQRWCQPR